MLYCQLNIMVQLTRHAQQGNYHDMTKIRTWRDISLGQQTLEDEVVEAGVQCNLLNMQWLQGICSEIDAQVIIQIKDPDLFSNFESQESEIHRWHKTLSASRDP